MPNSSTISSLKNKIMKSMVNNETLFYAINSPTIKNFENASELAYTHIFPYAQNPETIKDATTFITIEVDILEAYGPDQQWVKPTLIINIISSEKCMKVSNIPKVTANRNDYISQLIDNMFNGRMDLGYGPLTLFRNTGGSLMSGYLYRNMVFKTKDFNDSLCGK